MSPINLAPEAQVIQAGSENCLAIGTRVAEFEITGIVGEGGFGIVYLAFDHSLQRTVALKEYMPGVMAGRGDDQSVLVRSKRHQDAFQTGLRSFINEARLLAQFDHPALIKIHRFWEQNNTGYMAMRFYEGQTLKRMLQDAPGIATEAWLKVMLRSILQALDALYRVQILHRDISPENIMIQSSGEAVLLDFGAARQIISDMTQALTVILKPGYAPIEQYADDPSMLQGPWTDIYSLSAVMYVAITGRNPPSSVARMIQDPIESLAAGGYPAYSRQFLHAIDQGLAVKPEHRPQSIAVFRSLLGIEEPVSAAPTPTPGQTPGRASRARAADPALTRQMTVTDPRDGMETVSVADDAFATATLNTAGSHGRWEQANSVRPPPVQPRTRATMQASDAQAAWVSQVVETAEASPAGKSVQQAQSMKADQPTKADLPARAVQTAPSRHGSAEDIRQSSSAPASTAERAQAVAQADASTAAGMPTDAMRTSSGSTHAGDVDANLPHGAGDRDANLSGTGDRLANKPRTASDPGQPQSARRKRLIPVLCLGAAIVFGGTLAYQRSQQAGRPATLPAAGAISTAPAAAPAEQMVDEETVAWETLRQRKDASALAITQFQTKYPGGKYSDAAAAMLAQVRSAGPGASGLAVGPVAGASAGTSAADTAPGTASASMASGITTVTSTTANHAEASAATGPGVANASASMPAAMPPGAAADSASGASDAAKSSTAEASTGMVTLSIKPWANVLVDGVAKGVSPPLKRLQLSDGPHEVKVSNPNFPDHVVHIDVSHKKPARVRVDFTPAG